MLIDTAFFIVIIVMSVVIHEVSHGWVAYMLGDPTAKMAGRLTLNPIKHLDWFGSVLLPALLIMIGGFVIGWAKPVPYNPYNLRSGRWGPAYVAGAGPASNLVIALVFGLLFRLEVLGNLAITIIVLNIVLAIFNLIPVPPLDGSKILFALLPYRWRHIEQTVLRHQFVIFVLLILIIFNTTVLNRFVAGLLYLFAGV